MSTPKIIHNNFNQRPETIERGAKDTTSPKPGSFVQNSPFNTYNNNTNTYYNRKTAPQQLNPNNRLINENIIQNLLGKFGIKEVIREKYLYQLAFVHKSYVKSEVEKESDEESEELEILENSDEEAILDTEGSEDDEIKSSNINPELSSPQENEAEKNMVPFQDKPYERLEYIGDAILNAVIASYVFNRFPNQPEGFLTTLRTKLVRSQTLATLTAKLKLQKYIIISKHVEEKCRGRQNPRILEDIFEALIGALFLDFGPEDRGWQICQKFIVAVFENFIDITAMIRKEDNYKRILLEFYQKKYHTEPKYQVISMRGPTNRRTYTMGALSPTGEIIGIGIDRRKTDAEQKASRKALIYYGEDVDSDTEDDSESSDDSSDETSESLDDRNLNQSDKISSSDSDGGDVIGKMEI